MGMGHRSARIVNSHASVVSGRARKLAGAARCAVESLESRTLMATHVWVSSGAGATGTLWSDPANWQNGSVPQAGESDVVLDFSHNGQIFNQLQNDIPDLTLQSLVMGSGDHSGGPEYHMDGLPFTLTGSIQAAWAPMQNIDNDITLTGQVSVNAAMGETLDLNGLLGGSGGLTLTGQGQIWVTNSNSDYTGPTQLTGPFVTFGGINLADSNTLSIAVGNSSAVRNQLYLSNGTDLANAALSITANSNSPIGTPIVIANNPTNNPITGTFANLPQGSLIYSNQQTFKISYVGGDGNDVTLTRELSPTVVQVTEHVLPEDEGTEVVFDVVVTAADGSSVTGMAGISQITANGTSELPYGETLSGNGTTGIMIDRIPVPGTYQYFANYSGDATHAGSQSATVTDQINAESRTTISASATQAIMGQPITFNANVSLRTFLPPNPAPQGVVQWLVDGQAAGSGNSFSTDTLSAGPHTIKATFVPADNSNQSTSSANINVTILPTGQIPSTVQVTQTSVGANTSIHVAVQGDGGTPTGLVQLFSGTGPLTLAALDSQGFAEFAEGSWPAGETFTVQYYGDATFKAASSAEVPIQQGPFAPSTVSLSAVASDVQSNSVNVTLTAIVTVPPSDNPPVSHWTPVGEITFQSGDFDLGSALIDSTGRAVLMLPLSQIAGHTTITALFYGDSLVAPSTSDAMTVSLPVDPPASAPEPPTTPDTTDDGDSQGPAQIEPPVVQAPVDSTTQNPASQIPIDAPVQPPTSIAGPADRASGVYQDANPFNPAMTDLVIVGTAWNDKITIAKATGKNSAGKVKVTINGQSRVFAVSGRIVAYGLGGNDVICAKGLKQGVEFYGGAGNDTLTGGSGRDLLIGGSGADKLDGQGGDDLLVAGSSFDDPKADQATALAQVAGVWDSGAAYASRTAGVGALGLFSSFDDGSADTLTGGSGSDWFFANDAKIVIGKKTTTEDKLKDRSRKETVTAEQVRFD